MFIQNIGNSIKILKYFRVTSPKAYFMIIFAVPKSFIVR